MKVIQINTIYKYKSTGRTCWEVQKALERDGHISLTIHQVGDTSDKKYSIVVNSKPEYYLHKLLARLSGLDGYYSYLATRRLIKKIREYNPDIIHLRNLHGGYLNLPILFDYLAQFDGPVVYNLHDTWAYTGKCPDYAETGCEKWKKHCGNCPQWRNYPRSWFFDTSEKIFNDKKNWYEGIKSLTVVGVSDYMKTEASKSYLFNGRRVERIYNWIDLESFRPFETIKNIETREKYGLDERFLIISVASKWSNGKGFDEIEEVAQKLGDEFQICLVGDEKIRLQHSNMYHIPNTDSIEELARIYSCADVLVSLSTTESFGKTVAEAIACGTPVIVYNTTGIKEIPGRDCGYIIEPHDINNVVDAVKKVKAYGKTYYIKECRNRAEDLFNYKKNVNELITLYKELLEQYRKKEI